MEKNLLRGIQISKEEEVFLNKHGVKQLLTAIKNEDEDIFKRGMVITLPHQGLRSGELLGLLWSDIDFENKTLTVNRQRTSKGLGPPKSKSSYRTMTIEDDLINGLNWKEENEIIKNLEAGVDSKTVSTRLGHKNIDITANTYFITPEHERNS